MESIEVLKRRNKLTDINLFYINNPQVTVVALIFPTMSFAYA